ncbi:DoxX family protein [Rhizobium leguminosarum]|uniref:DoxX family protein n=1 Tax=Rhizobium leguminosarum TaxID=384 RepID=UPI001C944AF9|nr:DoxX family protein [Rhizobium leguminosarum]MBY5533693.1 DoxX family protein [Rhizobium leguminosarum]
MRSRIGVVLSYAVVILLLADAAVNLFAPYLLAAEMEAVGTPAYLAPIIGGILLICTVLYAIPRTAFLGAILITGFLGGAICTHLRVGEMFTPPQIICLLLGCAAWGGLFLRNYRIRSLMVDSSNSTA